MSLSHETIMSRHQHSRLLLMISADLEQMNQSERVENVDGILS
jgi:hypothetical protein